MSSPGSRTTCASGSRATAPPSRSPLRRGPMSTTGDRDRVRTLAVRGLQVRVSERAGRGFLADAPPLLLCNGIGASLEALQPLVDALHEDRGVIRFDVPGVGGSPVPPFPYILATLAPWVSAMVAKLGHREFDVLGLSCCLLYTSPSPRDGLLSRMPSSA